MNITLIIVLLVLLPFFVIQFTALLAVNKSSEKPNQNPKSWPKVSILLAARNEEKLILRSLNALDKLEYPEGQLEILIGDDDSTDTTYSLVKDFIADKPKFQLFHITKTMGKGRGKANVLAHLAHEAQGEFYMITDVDVQLPELWVKEMIASFEPETGILSGTTMCEPEPNMFARLQSMDWLHFMGYIKSFGNLGVACTSVGNNMAVRAEAYWQTGGFEKIEFSITEDYKLFQAVTGNGWAWKTLLSPNSLGLAYYIPSISEMLHQRKRWLIGAKDLPLNWKSMIVLYGLFIPGLVALASYSPLYFWIAWLAKFFFQTLFISRLCVLVAQKPFSLMQHLSYEIYVVLNTVVTAIFYFLPFASKWKGRTYNKAYIE